MAVLESIFLFILFKEHLLLLSEVRLPKLSTEEEVVNSDADATEDRKEDLEENVGLGTVFREPPVVGSLAPLTATGKYSQTHFACIERMNINRKFKLPVKVFGVCK